MHAADFLVNNRQRLFTREREDPGAASIQEVGREEDMQFFAAAYDIFNHIQGSLFVPASELQLERANFQGVVTDRQCGRFPMREYFAVE